MNTHGCPEYLRLQLDRWRDSAVPPCTFLQAVLRNDLRDALHAADRDSYRNLKNVVAYVHWELPAMCWGTLQRIREWAVVGGMNGIIEPAPAMGADADPDRQD